MKHEGIINRLLEDLRRQPDVMGVFLIGSLSRNIVRKRSDIDLMIMVRKRRKFLRDYRTIDGIWVEQFFITYENLRDLIDNRELATFYQFLEGKILYDPEGKLRDLKNKASASFKKYRPSRTDIRAKLQLNIDDILDEHDTGDLLSAIYNIYDDQYIPFEALFMLNGRMLPRFRDMIRESLRLKLRPPNYEETLNEIFLSPQPERRIDAYLRFSNWTLTKLGGRLKRAKF